MRQGFLSIVLHAHLPYVRHPEYPEFMEESWFFEATTETYIPLINVFESLVHDNIDFRITMSLTPPLVSMFTDQLLQERYSRHLDKSIELSYKEIDRTRNDHHLFHESALMYKEKFERCRYTFNKYHRNLALAFKWFQDIGKLEIVTCGATHGFLPLLKISKAAIRAQIHVAANHYEENFKCRPRGIWLPECGYYAGVEEILKEAGIRYFFVDTHSVLYGSSRPKYGINAPIYCPNGVAAFGRDQESSKQVWSAKEGYPGDFCYREFYRDIGYDLDFNYIKPYIHPDGIRTMTGIKYHKITGNVDLGAKEPYNHRAAVETAANHAGNFLFNRTKQFEHFFGITGGKKPIVIAPYDAELFGHWWYEGPDFLNFLLRKIACDQDIVGLKTPSEYLFENPKNQVSTPTFSSWGDKGYAEVWLNGSNDWIYRHLHEMAFRMEELANTYDNPDENLTRALNQCARELLLAQSSDWAFIMNGKTTVEYAIKRTKDHIYRFNKIYDEIKSFSLDMNFLAQMEWRDNIFKNVNYRIYRTK